MRVPLAFIDTETLGLDPDVHSVWEIGLILETDGMTIEHTWQLMLDERAIELAHPEALRISGFADRYDIDKAVSALDALVELQRFTAGAHLVGAVVSFDEERLRRAMWREGLHPRWHYHLIDVEALAVGYLASNPNLRRLRAVEQEGARHVTFDANPPWDSSLLSRALGVDPDGFEKHTALGNAAWARAMYHAIVG